MYIKTGQSLLWADQTDNNFKAGLHFQIATYNPLVLSYMYVARTPEESSSLFRIQLRHKWQSLSRAYRSDFVRPDPDVFDRLSVCMSFAGWLSRDSCS